MDTQQYIFDWIIEHEGALGSYFKGELAVLHDELNNEPEFFEEIIYQFKENVKYTLGEEISRQTGMAIDTILEVLEEPSIQDYIYDSICSNYKQ